MPFESSDSLDIIGESISRRHHKNNDFYQLFPSELKELLAPSHLVTRRNRLKKNPSIISYAELPSARQLFMDLSRIQSITLRYIYAKSVIDTEQFLSGLMLLNDRAMNNVLDESINEHIATIGDLLAFLSALAEVPLNGLNGLKHASVNGV